MQGMTDETAALIDRLRRLLDSPLESTPNGRARVEHVLTEGYARALELEASRRRIEKQIDELSGVLEDGADERRVMELATLARRRSLAHDEITHLRGTLGALRDRLSAAGSASPCTST
jgi:hypothetical protein